jgi:hypothetical protein
MLPWSADASRRHPPVIALAWSAKRVKSAYVSSGAFRAEKNGHRSRSPLPLHRCLAPNWRWNTWQRAFGGWSPPAWRARNAPERSIEFDMSHSMRLANCHIYMHEPYNHARSPIRKPIPACIGGSQDTITCNSSVRDITWILYIKPNRKRQP